LLFHAQEKEQTLMIEQVWKHMGATPFVDEDHGKKPVGNETAMDTAREVTNQVP